MKTRGAYRYVPLLDVSGQRVLCPDGRWRTAYRKPDKDPAKSSYDPNPHRVRAAQPAGSVDICGVVDRIGDTLVFEPYWWARHRALVGG